MKCVQCKEDMKSFGGVEQMERVTFLFVCLRPECPNFCLAQIGLTEEE